jgi:periplasmic protein TonB
MSTGSLPSPWADELLAGPRLHRTLMWTVGLLLALMAHAGAITLAFRDQEKVMAEASSPSPAIMIELAAVAQAVDATRNEITTETTSTVETKAAPQPDPEPEPEAVEEPRPEREVKPSTVLPRDAVVLPEREIRPKPEKKKPPIRKTEKRPRRDPPAANSRAATAAAAEVATSDRNAASRAVAGIGASSLTPATWQSRLMAHLERHKRYPAGARMRGEQGIGGVRFTIDENGNVLSASLVHSSGSVELDAEVVALAHRASPVPAPPTGVGRTITAPVRFSFR